MLKTNFTRPTDVIVGISRGLEKPPRPMPQGRAVVIDGKSAEHSLDGTMTLAGFRNVSWPGSPLSLARREWAWLL